MATFKFFISTPLDDGTYSEFQDITDDALENSVSNLKQNLSSNDYDIGSIKFNKIALNLRNENAKYSSANNPLSIFTRKRDESILKIEWDRNTDTAWAGNFPCGLTYLSEPVEVYKGLLEDNSSKFDADNQIQSFTFLGLESIIGKTQVNYADLSVTDDVTTTIYKLLNQPNITKLLTVDQTNITVNLNYVPDDLSPIENKTVLKALDELLFLAGAVLFVKDDAIIVQPRNESIETKFTFYSPASDLGIENVHDISSFSLGLNRTFNFWTWNDSDLQLSFQDSIEQFGFREKEVSSDIITNPTTRQGILNSLLTEFGFPKIEMDIEVPLTTPILKDIFLLDKVKVDYPADYRGNDDFSLPSSYGTAVYGQSSYIRASSALIIDIGDDWKVLNRNIAVKNQKMVFKIREV